MGDPGFGKTWLLKAEALRTAETARAVLDEFSDDLADTVVPLLLPLAVVAEHLGPGVALDTAVLAGAQARYPLPGGWPSAFQA